MVVCVQLSLGVIKQILMNVLFLYIFFLSTARKYVCVGFVRIENTKCAHQLIFTRFLLVFIFIRFPFIGHFTHTFCIKSYFIPIFGDNLRYGPILNAVHILFYLGLEGAIVLIFSLTTNVFPCPIFTQIVFTCAPCMVFTLPKYNI